MYGRRKSRKTIWRPSTHIHVKKKIEKQSENLSNYYYNYYWKKKGFSINNRHILKNLEI